jgi:hypothetical protein
MRINCELLDMENQDDDIEVEVMKVQKRRMGVVLSTSRMTTLRWNDGKPI